MYGNAPTIVPCSEGTSQHDLPEGDEIGEAVHDRQLKIIHGRIGKPIWDRLRLRRQVPVVAVDIHRQVLDGKMEHGAVAEPNPEGVQQLTRPVNAGASDSAFPDRPKRIELALGPLVPPV